MNDLAEGREIMTVESGTVALLEKAQVDQQIATAHQYPRSITKFRNETMAMVTLTEKVAGECIYALPRDGKVIEGPSARFAEVIASAWGNARAGARIVDEGTEFVTAQGVFHDLEKNVAITYEVRRRITDKQGRRFKPDMIGVTANAACSIALRNAILKGVPKAFWAEMYDAARHAAVGDVKSIANKRANAVQAFVPYGISEAQILKRLGRNGVPDITVDDLITLAGFLTAIKDGDGSPESIFAEEAPTTSSAVKDINDKVKAAAAAQTNAPATPAAPAATDKQAAEGKAAEMFAPPSYAELVAALERAHHDKDAEAIALAESAFGGVKDAAHRADLRSRAERIKADIA